MLLHLLRLSCVGQKNVHLSKTTDRFRANFDCKTAFTTTRVYIEKLLSLSMYWTNTDDEMRFVNKIGDWNGNTQRAV